MAHRKSLEQKKINREGQIGQHCVRRNSEYQRYLKMKKEMDHLSKNFDVAILGGGMVGLSIANQLIEKKITKNIVIIEKESQLGAHTSGRNSGVLHAGIYYKPKTIKAKVCVEGSKRLQEWIKDRGLPINQCGKVIVPTKKDLDGQLDILRSRGIANGATVEVWDEKQLYEAAPEAKSASGRALWSPNTAVVKPIKVIQTLQKELEEKGVTFLMNEKNWANEITENKIKLTTGKTVSYGYLFNCTGLHADSIAHKFGVGLEYKIMPFKGLYWQIRKECNIQPKMNIYPVPDLNVPFLGVHITPSADPEPIVTIGPTATPAWGRENYRGWVGIEPELLIRNSSILAKQYILNQGSFRRYTHEQAFLSLQPLLLRSARLLIPELTSENIERSQKIAIRSQLYNKKTMVLEDDFICLKGMKSTHVLNAISPAFTASFALGDLILAQSGLEGMGS